MLHYFLLGITPAFAAAVQPGPLQTFLISQALSKGWRKTLPATLAPLLSDGPIIALVVWALTSVPGRLITVLQFGGGALLLYLAFSAWKTWREYDPDKALGGSSGGQTLLKAVLVNLLNPNPYIGWSLLMGPLLVQGWRESPAHGIGLLLGFYGTLVACSAGIVLLFASARSLGPRLTRAMILVSAVALAGFAAYEFWAAGQAFFGAG